MNITILAYGMSFFCLCLAVHIVIWRIKTPWVSSFVLLVIFLVIPFILSIFALAFPAHTLNMLHISRIEYLEVLLFHFALSSAYIACYPAARAISPSLDVLIMIAAATNQKLTGRQIIKGFSDLRLVTSRVDDLRSYRFIVEKNGRIEITFISKFIIRSFILYRKILGLPIGQG